MGDSIYEASGFEIGSSVIIVLFVDWVVFFYTQLGNTLSPIGSVVLAFDLLNALIGIWYFYAFLHVHKVVASLSVG